MLTPLQRKRWSLVQIAAVPSLLLLGGCPADVPVPSPRPVISASFDPLSMPRVLPQPNDLDRDLGTGLLVVADAPGGSAAQLEYNQYLRTLDGFDQTTRVTASFSAALDPMTLVPSTEAHDGSVAVVDVGERRVLSPDEYGLALESAGTALTVVPLLAATRGRTAREPWRLGHTYLVLLFGGDDPLGLRAPGGAHVYASPATFFVRGTSPLLTSCEDGSPDRRSDRCLCPALYGAGSALDPTCHAATGLSLAEAQLLEPERRRLSSLLTDLLPSVGVRKKRENLVLAWTFTIAHGPFAVFEIPAAAVDSTQARLPFPNDVLRDFRAGKLALVLPGNPPGALQNFVRGLDRLDGFSTTGDLTVDVDVADDAPGGIAAAPIGIAAGSSALLVNLTQASARPEFSAHAQLINGGQDYDGRIALGPTRPLLGDGDRYLAALTSGVTDARLRPLRPSPSARLLLLDAPLYAEGRSTLPALLSDDNAQTLETVRKALVQAGSWESAANLLGVPRDQLAVAWTFRTQSMTKTLQDVADFPSSHALPTDVKLLGIEPAATRWGPNLDREITGLLHTHVALSSTGALDLNGGTDVDVPFLLVTPKGAPPTGAKVVIVQHGIGGWRGDIRAIADAFAAEGWATLGIDVNLHGGRTICRAATDCAGGTCGPDGICSTKLLVHCPSDEACSAGTCDGRTGQCTGAYAVESSLCIGWHDVGGAQHSECRPSASGGGFWNLGAPLVVRDNLLQHVLDLAQLFRVVRSADPAGLQASLLASGISLDVAEPAFFGQSLGGITGALFVAAAPEPIVAVLNVPAARLADLWARSAVFSSALGGSLAALGAPADTALANRYLDYIRLAIDPADPINYARHLVTSPLGSNAPKKIIVQEAGRDAVVPGDLPELLAKEIGLPFTSDGKPAQFIADPNGPPGARLTVSTFFKNATHSFALTTNPEPSTAAGQKQAVKWIASGGASLSAP